jgi:hypothetical protein
MCSSSIEEQTTPLLHQSAPSHLTFCLLPHYIKRLKTPVYYIFTLKMATATSKTLDNFGHVSSAKA